jgi:hypothetical protein
MFVVIQVEFAYLIRGLGKQWFTIYAAGTLISMQSAKTLASAHRLVRGGNIVIEENMSSRAEYASW